MRYDKIRLERESGDRRRQEKRIEQRREQKCANRDNMRRQDKIREKT